MHTHMRLHAVRRTYRAGAQCCHHSAVSLAGCFGCRSPRVKVTDHTDHTTRTRPPSLSTCPLYPVGPCVPLPTVNLLLSLAVGAAPVISAACVVLLLIDAFVPNSFFLPCALIAAAVTHKRLQPIFTRGSFPSKAKCPSRGEHCC